MGLAELPRAYFSGFAYWNPSTMNNNDNQPSYDPASATLNWPWLERHGLAGDAEFDAYVTQREIVSTANDALDSNIITTAPPAEWNFYGDNSCGFVQEDEPIIEWPAKFSKPAGAVAITGYTDERCRHVTSGDTWIDQPVRLNAGLDAAKLVDVDPVAPWSSQIFHDTFGIGSEDAAAGVTGGTAGRAHSRWVYMRRNLNLSGDVIIAGIGSALFQIGLPSDGLVFFDRDPPPGSLAEQLRDALARPGIQGLMVRFVTYHTIYFQGSAFTVRDRPDWSAISDLYAEYAAELRKYQRGEVAAAPPPPVNRAYSNVVGWIAPWRRDELRTAPVGRILHSQAPVQPVNGELRPWPLGPAVLEYAVDDADPQFVSRVALDLGSTIPERDSSLGKVDFGALQLGLRPDDEAVVKPFAAIEYDGGYNAAAYVATAGVVDIPASQFLEPLSVSDLQHQLVVSFRNPVSGETQVGLREAEYTAETDDRAVYLDEPGAPWSPPDRSLVVQIRHRGGKPPAGTQLRIAQYSPNPPGFGELGWHLVSGGERAQTPYFRMLVEGQAVDDRYVTVTAPNRDDGLPYATVAIGLAALRSGPPVAQFTPLPPSAPEGAPPATVGLFATTQEFFANVRVLPFHNAMTAAFANWLHTGPGVDVVTQRVFDAVFRTFFLMYPAMRFIRDPLQFQAWRGPIVAVTDPAGFETAAYMPVTRSLSAGQRHMLELWNSYLGGELPTPPPGERVGRRG